MLPVWTRVATLEDLRRRGVLVVRPPGRQIALFETGEGVRACNNRCPHEGYPLSEGTLDGRCVLTCNWHNWKFDLGTGENLYGGDRLRTYPVEVRAGEIWVDLADPPVEERCRAILGNLRDAFADNDYERLARELGRLHLLGGDDDEALREAIGWAYERLEFGWTHAFAGIADWLALAAGHPGEAEVGVACRLEGLAHLADDVLREERYPYTEASLPYDEDAFVGAVEGEDEAGAVAYLRGALAAGLGFDGVERGLVRAALAHYHDFGHSAIYVTKARRLVERLGDEVAEPVLLSLARHLVYARREDLIPEFRGYADALARWGSGTADPPAPGRWRGLGIGKALEETVRASAAPPSVLFDALLGANAVHLLAYDIAQQEKIRIPVDDNVGWLDFTHAVTFAAAVREICARHPDLWPPALLQMACFAGRNARYTVPEPPVDAWTVGDAGAFFAREVERVLDHRHDEFIVAVHQLKTLLAGRDLVRSGLSRDTETALLAGLNRFLHSPVRRKHVRRTVHQALTFVARDG